MYFPRNWEFGSAFSKLQNFGVGVLNPPQPPSVRHWVPPLQRHNLTSQETWTQTYTSLPIFTDRVYWDCWWFVQPWPHPKTKWGFQRNPTIGTWQVTQSTQMWKQIKKYSAGTALFSFQEGGQIVSTTDKRCASRRQRHACDNATVGYKELLITPTRTQHFATQLSSDLVARRLPVARQNLSGLLLLKWNEWTAVANSSDALTSSQPVKLSDH
jgi:hypothetical protein